MNVLGVYRANGLGQFSPSRQQRTEAAASITANLRARLLGLQGGVAKMAAMQAKQTNESGSEEATTLVGNSDLNRDMFLQLLMEQIRNQDPLEPVSNEDMLAQLAQFSSLEQMTQVNDRMGDMQSQLDFLNGSVDQLNFLTAQNMIGQRVRGAGTDGVIIDGTVDAVTLQGSIVVLNVNGAILPMTNVIDVGNPPAPASETGGS
jgi:flagellar basal-body rod modification protein FlgD